MPGTRTRAAGALKILVVGGEALAESTRAAVDGARRSPTLAHAADPAAARELLWPDRPGEHFDLILIDAADDASAELLSRIKGDAGRRQIPVLVLYARGSAARAADCWRRHANACLELPDDPANLVPFVAAIARYWLDGNVLLAPPPAPVKAVA